MKATILVDNNAACGLDAEWGLSVYIEYGDKNILLDTGASGLFTANAEKLGLNLQDIDFGILSHAHYDHADGMDAFFEVNSNAPFYLSGNAGENCYSIEKDRNSKEYGQMKYDGIKKGILKKYSDRIIYTDSICQKICDGVYLLGHSTPGLEKIGERVGQYVADGPTGISAGKGTGGFVPDSFNHEQSLIFRTDKGLVVFNSCSHAGVDNIIREVRDAFPGEAVYGIIGGFHMYLFNESEVKEHAERILSSGVKHIVTGHCTGERQYRWLKKALSRDCSSHDTAIRVEQLHCGLELEF